jgi:hypothetical protein
MLAGALISIKVAPELAEMGKLCPQEDIIIAKFNKLLARLNSNSAARNASDLAAFAKQEKAIQDWLDIESEYRLASGKAAKSKEGAEYAQGQYEKWNAMLTASKARQDALTKENVAKQADIDEERALIKELLGLIDVLQTSEVMHSNNQAAVLKQFNQKVICAVCLSGCVSELPDLFPRRMRAVFADTPLLKTFALALTHNIHCCSFWSFRTEMVSGWLRQVTTPNLNVSAKNASAIDT